MMKRKIYVLIFSIVVAFLVAGIAIYGMVQAKKRDDRTVETGSKDKGKEEENTLDTQESDTQETDSSEEVSNEETTSVPETTSANPQTGFQNSTIDPGKPMVALTFDDGPVRENTTKILDALKQYNAHATFFVVGYNVDGNEDILKRMTDEGSEVGSHTLSHSKLTALDVAGLSSEVDGMAEKIKNITGQERVVIRPPYGAVDDNVMAALKDPVILWSIDTEDWKTRSVETTIQNIQGSVYDGAIILMHDLYGESAEAAVQIIEWLDSQGYQMVTVSELGYYRRGGLQTGVKYGALKPN